jgi:hypothetical protein
MVKKLSRILTPLQERGYIPNFSSFQPLDFASKHPEAIQECSLPALETPLRHPVWASDHENESDLVSSVTF